MQKKLFIFILIFTITLAAFSFALAQERPLETTYPDIPGIEAPTEETSLTDYIRYIFYLFIGISGIIAFGIVVIAGFEYLTSTGVPEKLKDAKDRIAAAFLGLLILFCSVLILKTINPQLILPQPTKLPITFSDLKPGILVCEEQVIGVKSFFSVKEAAEQEQDYESKKQKREFLEDTLDLMEKHCAYIDSQGAIPKEFNDKITWVYLVPDPGKTQYGVIFYEETNFGGNAVIFPFPNFNNQFNIKSLETPVEWKLLNDQGGQVIKASSARPFVIDYEPNPTSYARLYKSINWNYDDAQAETLCVNAGSEDFELIEANTTITCKGILIDGVRLWDVIPKISSLEIEGDLFVVFFKIAGGPAGEAWNTATEIDVFTSSDMNLNDNKMGTWNYNCFEEKDWEAIRYPCAAEMAIYSASFY